MQNSNAKVDNHDVKKNFRDSPHVSQNLSLTKKNEIRTVERPYENLSNPLSKLIGKEKKTLRARFDSAKRKIEEQNSISYYRNY